MSNGMLEYLTITPAPRVSLPPELALLAALVELTPPKPNPQPVPAWPRETPPPDDPAPVGERVGRVVGAILDNQRHLSHFVVRLNDDGRSVLIPTHAVDITDERGTPVVRVPWTATQLAAQPRLHNATELPPEYEEHPIIWWEGNTPVPPGGDLFEKSSGAKEAAVAGGASAALGAIIGTLAGGPIVGAGLALFFGLGGGLAGGMTGGSREEAADAQWLYKDGDKPRTGELGVFEHRLLDASLYDRGVLQAQRMTMHGLRRQEARAVDVASAHR
jgi:hypothetical protein